MNNVWNVELHSHTMWSKDCLMSYETIIQKCKARGVDRIAVTDHNTAEGALRMQQIAPELVIVGEEIMTTEGEILAYFVQETVPAGLTPDETIRRLRDQGAVISVSHPFDRLRKGAWEEPQLRRLIGLVDAIEIFNARCLYAEDNEKALAFATEHKLLGTAGSDAHSTPEYGMSMTVMKPFHDASEFLLNLQEANYIKRLSPFYVHGFSTTAKWIKRFGLRPRLWSGG